MSLDAFTLSVEGIANVVWAKFGPDGWNSPAAYAEIKAQVQYCSWIVSDDHARQVLSYTKYAPWQEGQSKRTTRADAVSAMIHAVEEKLGRIVLDNEVFYWQVKFVETGRFLMMGEIDSQPTSEERSFKVALTFCTEIEAEEAAEEFCIGYLAAGVVPPKIHIVGFNSAHQEIPHSKMFVGPAAKKPSARSSYPATEIPNWCKMSIDEHQDGAGGCWGISYGEVARKGEDHCENCEYHG